MSRATASGARNLAWLFAYKVRFCRILVFCIDESTSMLRKSIDDVNHPHWHVRTCIAMRKIDVLTCTHGIPADAELMEAIKT